MHVDIQVAHCLWKKCLILTEESSEVAFKEANCWKFICTNYSWNRYISFILLLYFKVNQEQATIFFGNNII